MADRSDLPGMIVARAERDPGFIEWLQREPRAALSELTGIEIPEFVEIVVHQDSLTKVNIVVPADLSTNDLSDSDLEAVAGGDWEWYASKIEAGYNNEHGS